MAGPLSIFTRQEREFVRLFPAAASAARLAAAAATLLVSPAPATGGGEMLEQCMDNVLAGRGDDIVQRVVQPPQHTAIDCTRAYEDGALVVRCCC